MKLSLFLCRLLVLAPMTSHAQVSPVIRQDLQDSEKTVGQTLTLNCSATGSPTLTYSWTKDGTTIPGQSGSTYDVSVSRLGAIGVFSCKASNTWGQDTSSARVVGKGVSSTLSDQTLNTKGASVMFQLSVYSLYSATFIWKIGNTKLTSSGLHVITHDSHSSTQGVTKGYLKITYNSAASVLNLFTGCTDSGRVRTCSAVYKAEASTSKDWYSAQCTVYVKIRLPLTPQEVSMTRNSSTTILLNIPPADLGDGVVFKYRLQYKMLTDTTYKNSKFLNTAGGAFLVSPLNPFTTYEFGMVLETDIPPILKGPVRRYRTKPQGAIIKHVLTSQELQVPSKFVQNCTAEGTPPITYEWTKDRKRVGINPVFEIKGVQLKDNGLYECTAINRAGSSSTSLFLVVKGIWPKLQPKVLKENYEAVLQCSMHGTKNLTINWFKDDKLIEPDEDSTIHTVHYLSYNTERRTAQRTLTIHFTSAEEMKEQFTDCNEDYCKASYKCVVNYDLGEEYSDTTTVKAEFDNIVKWQVTVAVLSCLLILLLLAFATVIIIKTKCNRRILSRTPASKYTHGAKTDDTQHSTVHDDTDELYVNAPNVRPTPESKRSTNEGFMLKELQGAVAKKTPKPVDGPIYTNAAISKPTPGSSSDQSAPRPGYEALQAIRQGNNKGNYTPVVTKKAKSERKEKVYENCAKTRRV